MMSVEIVAASVGSVVADFWNDQLVEHNREAVFLVLLGFLLSFSFIRLSTRLMRSPRVPWWPGSIVSESGVHLHHLVFGIVTMMLAGVIGFVDHGETAWFLVAAAAFGVGIGLTIDEFALWVHLEDVYWAEEGRQSIDATVITALVLALILFGIRPFEILSDSPEALVASLITVALVMACVMTCLLKDRFMHAVVGFFIWPVALYGAVRLAKPRSRWAKKRYGTRKPGKQARAEKRFREDRRTERFKEWFRTAVGGGISAE